MSSLSLDDVKKLAAMSSLELSDDQATSLRAELRTILDYVDQLDEVDTEQVTPTYQLNDLSNVMRADTVVDYGVDRDKLLKTAPHVEADQLKVKRVIE